MESAGAVGNALFVTQYYRPESIGSGPFCGDVAEALVARGFRVRVLTARLAAAQAAAGEQMKAELGRTK